MVPGQKKKNKKNLTVIFFFKRAITGQNRSVYSVTWNWTALISNSPQVTPQLQSSPVQFSSVQSSPVQSSPEWQVSWCDVLPSGIETMNVQSSTNIRPQLNQHGEPWWHPATETATWGEERRVPPPFCRHCHHPFVARWLLPSVCFDFCFTTYLPTYLPTRLTTHLLVSS